LNGVSGSRSRSARPDQPGALYGPSGLLLLPDGSLYLTEARSHRVRRVSPDGHLSNVAGTGAPGFSGDKGPAAKARLWNPAGLARDSAGNLYIADTLNQRVRILAPDGTINTIAGGPPQTPAAAAPNAPDETLKEPTAVAVDASDRLAIADAGNGLVRRRRADGTLETIAGGGTDPPEVGRSALGARLWEPVALAYGPNGDLAIADASGRQVWIVGPGGLLRRVIGSGKEGTDIGDNDPAKAELDRPDGLAYNPAGDLFILCRDRVLKYAADGVLSTAGDSDTPGWNETFGRSNEDASWSEKIQAAVRRFSKTNQLPSLHWVEAPRVDFVGANEAVLTWETDPPAGATVEYGHDDRLGRIRAIPTVSARSSLLLTDLEPGRVYLFRVTAFVGSDRQRGEVTSRLQGFTTRASGEPLSPVEDPPEPPEVLLPKTTRPVPHRVVINRLRHALGLDGSGVSYDEALNALERALGLQ
jgi:hypothetical protein